VHDRGTPSSRLVAEELREPEIIISLDGAAMHHGVEVAWDL